MLPTHRPPTHPGEMLLKEFLEPLGVSQAEAATRMSRPRMAHAEAAATALRQPATPGTCVSGSVAIDRITRLTDQVLIEECFCGRSGWLPLRPCGRRRRERRSEAWRGRPPLEPS